MLEQLTTVPAPGQTVALTLTFARAGTVTVDLPVVAIGSDPSSTGMSGMPGMGG